MKHIDFILPPQLTQDQNTSQTGLDFHPTISLTQKSTEGFSSRIEFPIQTENPNIINTNPSVRIDLSANITSIIQPLAQKKKSKLLGSGTFKVFMKRRALDRGFSMESEYKSRPNLLNKGDVICPKSKTELTTSFKGNGDGGKMYANELWSRKYHNEVVRSSLLGEQQDKILKSGFQTTEEKAREMNEIFYSSPTGRNNLTNSIVHKFQRADKITDKDLSLDPSDDYSLMVLQDRTASTMRNNNVSTFRNLLKNDLDVSKDYVEMSAKRPEPLRPKGYFLPTLETNSPTLQERLVKAGSFRSKKKHLTDIISPISPISTRGPGIRVHQRYNTSLKLRPKMVHIVDGSTEEIDYSPFSANTIAYTLEKIPPLDSNSTSQICSNSMTTQKGSAGLSPELPRRRPARKEKSAESRILVNDLLDRCRDFHADKSLSKMVKEAMETFTEDKVTRFFKEQRKKTAATNREQFIKFYSNISENKKKRESHGR